MPDVVNSEGHTPPEIKGALKTKEYTRTEVLQALDFSTNILRQSITAAGVNGDPDLGRLNWILKSVEDAKAKSINRPATGGAPKDTVTVDFTDHHTGANFSQEEGIPVDQLINLLIEKAKDVNIGTTAKNQLVENALALFHNSEFFNKMHSMDPSRFLSWVQNEYDKKTSGRVHEEAYYIAQDRDKGSLDANWFQAEEDLLNRRELIIPKEKDVIVEPPIDKIPPPVDPPIEPPKPPIPAPPPGPIVEPPVGPEPPIAAPVPPTVDQVRRDFVLINRTKDIEKRARDFAERRLRQEMRQGSVWNPMTLFRKVQLHVGEDYYRQIYIDEARQAMLTNNNSFLDMDLATGAVTNAMGNIAQERAAGKAKVEQVRLLATSGEKLYGHNIQDATENFRKLMTDDIIRPLVNDLQSGRPVDEARVQSNLRVFMQTHETTAPQEIRDQINAFFGRDAQHSERGNLAEYFATDMIDMAQQVVNDLNAQKYTLNEIDKFINIKLGYTSWAAETQANLDTTDRLIAGLQRDGRTRWLANPAFVGAVTSLAAFGTTKLFGWAGTTANFVVPGLGMLTGGLLAARRRNTELKIDHAAHKVERAYNRQILPNSPRREQSEDFAYNLATFDDLINGNGTDPRINAPRLSLASLTANPTANTEAIIHRITEIKARLNRSTSTRSDFVQFEDEYNPEQTRTELLRVIIDTKQQLRNAGVSDAHINAREIANLAVWDALLLRNKQDQDRAERCYRVRKSIIAGGAASGAGLGFGLLGQQAATELARHVPIVSEIPVIGSMFQKGQTAIEKGLNFGATILGRPDIAAPYKELLGGVDIQNLINSPGDHLIHNDATKQDLHLLIRDRLSVLSHADQALQPKYQAFDTTFLGHDDRKIDFLTTAKQDIPEPPIWLKQAGDQQASFIVSGGKDFLPPEVKDMYQGWDYQPTHEHNLKEYMQSLTKDGIGKTPDVVLAHGNFLLNTHDIHQSDFLNAEGLSYDEWAQKVGRIDPVTGLVEQGKMSITHPSSGITLHGFLRSDGSFDVNKNFFVDNQYPGNTQLTAVQWDSMVKDLKVEGWAVDNTPTGFHITPPEAFELKPLVNETPIIPIPVVGRFPLEPLGKPDNPNQDRRQPPSDQTPPDDSTPPTDRPTPPGNGQRPPVTGQPPVDGPRTNPPGSSPDPDRPVDGADATINIPRGPRTPQNGGGTAMVVPIPELSPLQTLAVEANLPTLRAQRQTAIDDPDLPDHQKTRIIADLDNQITVLEETLVFPPGARDIPAYMTAVIGAPNPNSRYFIPNVPTALSQALTNEQRLGEILAAIPTTAPFFIPRPDGYITANNDITPLNDYQNDTRYQNAEAATRGTSGFFALIAASAATPEEQAQLYDTSSRLIIAMHRSNHDHLANWLTAQDVPMTIPDPNNPGQNLPFSPLAQVRGYDTPLPLADRILGYDQDGVYDQDETVRLWQTRMNELTQRLQQGRLEPHHLAWIEFLSNSVNLRTLMDEIRSSGINTSPPPGPANAGPTNPPPHNPVVTTANPDNRPPIESFSSPQQMINAGYSLTEVNTAVVKLIGEGKLDRHIITRMNNALAPEAFAPDRSIPLESPLLVTPRHKQAAGYTLEENQAYIKAGNANIPEDLAAARNFLQSRGFPVPTRNTDLRAAVVNAISQTNADGTPKATPASPTTLEAKQAIKDLNNEPEQRSKRFVVAEATEKSPRHLDRNEDTVISDALRGFIGVFDGMGGITGGEVASKIVSDEFTKSLRTLPINPTQDQITKAMLAANESARIALASEEVRTPKYKGFGTTGTILQLFDTPDGKRHAMLMHKGDSRAFAVKTDGSMIQISQDHSLVSAALASGTINATTAHQINSELDETDGVASISSISRNYFLRRNEIAGGFGAQEFQYQLEDIEIGPDIAYLLITSDGVHDNEKRSEMDQIVRNSANASEIASNLVQAAQNRLVTTTGRTKPDDTSAVVLTIPKTQTTP